MKSFFIVEVFCIIAFIGVCRCLTPEEARVRQNVRSNLGLPAAVNQFPHHVHLRIISNGGVITSCSGALISNSWVLTTAHCLQNFTMALVRLGNSDITTPEIAIWVFDINGVVHPKYNPLNSNNDIALLRLQKQVPIIGKIKPIRLTKRTSVGVESWEGYQTLVSGWGITNELARYSGQIYESLRYQTLNVISNAQCSTFFDNNSIVVNSTVCASGNNFPGDSGSPLIVTEEDGEVTLIGVGSFVNSITNPSGYVRPEYFLDWIKQYATDVNIRP